MKLHSTKVPHYRGSVKELAVDVCKMRYDYVFAFFEECAWEFERQARQDRIRGRVKLSKKLERVVTKLDQLREEFKGVIEICQPHIHREKKRRS